MRNNAFMLFRVMVLCCAVSVSAVVADSVFGESSGRMPELPGAQEPLLSNERMTDGKTAIKAVFAVAAAPAAVYETLRDAARFPEFMPDTREVRIEAAGPGYQVACFHGGEGLFESTITLKRLYDDRSRRISWSMVKGRPRAVNGFWQVDRGPDDRHAVVTYVNYIDPGFWLPDALARAFIRKNISHIAENLRRRVASGDVWKSAEYLRRMQ